MGCGRGTGCGNRYLRYGKLRKAGLIRASSSTGRGAGSGSVDPTAPRRGAPRIGLRFRLSARSNQGQPLISELCHPSTTTNRPRTRTRTRPRSRVQALTVTLNPPRPNRVPLVPEPILRQFEFGQFFKFWHRKPKEQRGQNLRHHSHCCTVEKRDDISNIQIFGQHN